MRAPSWPASRCFWPTSVAAGLVESTLPPLALARLR
jgi:hypothetical protein